MNENVMFHLKPMYSHILIRMMYFYTIFSLDEPQEYPYLVLKGHLGNP